MTVQKDVTKNIYVGNGSTRTFPFTFECPAEHPEYIKVYLMQDDGTALATSDYQLDMDAKQITYPSSGTALPEDKKLVIMRELPLQQMMNLVNNGPYFAEDIETAFDECVMAMQQIAEKLNRSIIMSVDIDGDAFVNEVPFEAGKSFRIADDGKSIVLTEDPAKVLPLVQGVYAQTQTQAQNAIASAAAAAKSEDNAAASANAASNSAQSASASAASAAESAELTSGYKQEALTAKADATASATNAKASEANAKISENNAEASKEAAQSAATTASNFANASRSSANEARTYRDNAKNYSENVNVFTPSVSEDGILSWTNKAGLPNPPSVNIKGKDGADGGVTVDDTLSDTSTNPVQNKVVKSALDNRAVLDESNTFTSPNRFDDIYMADGMSSLKWYNGSPNFVVASINSKRYTGEANTAKKATQDDAGNVITSTYATKTELNSCVKTVNNVAPDSNGNVNITVSGGGSGVTVDEELSSTSTNPVQNKTIYNALLNKAGTDIFSGFDLNSPSATIRWRSGSQNYGILTASNYSGTALRATQDGAGNIIADTYAKKTDVSGVVKSVNGTKPDSNGNVTISVSGGSNVTVDTTLSATSTNPIANKTVYSALEGKLGKTETAYAATKATQDGAGNVITETYTKKADFDKTIGQLQVAFQEKVDRSDLSDVATSGQYSDLRGKPEYVVQSVNNVRPDENGNVSISVSGGGGVSTSESNTWTAQQNFHDLMLNQEKYATYVVNGTSDTPITSTMVYAVTGAFTLNLATLAGALSASQSSVFTAYFAANADYSLTISNAGKLKYTGSASDVAITTSGLLINIWMSKDGGGTLTSIVQATKLS